MRHPGPTREFAEWLLERKVRWLAVDAGTADHPMNTVIRRMRPDEAEEAEAKLGRSLDEIFPKADYQIMHTLLFPHDVMHIENLGGDDRRGARPADRRSGASRGASREGRPPSAGRSRSQAPREHDARRARFLPWCSRRHRVACGRVPRAGGPGVGRPARLARLSGQARAGPGGLGRGRVRRDGACTARRPADRAHRDGLPLPRRVDGGGHGHADLRGARRGPPGSLRRRVPDRLRRRPHAGGDVLARADAARRGGAGAPQGRGECAHRGAPPPHDRRCVGRARLGGRRDLRAARRHGRLRGSSRAWRRRGRGRGLRGGGEASPRGRRPGARRGRAPGRAGARGHAAQAVRRRGPAPRRRAGHPARKRAGGSAQAPGNTSSGRAARAGRAPRTT